MTEEKTNKLITIMLAIIICAAAITILFVNLPQEDISTNEEEQGTPKVTDTVLLNISYNNTFKEYTLAYIEGECTATTGTGRYVKSKLLPDTVLITPDLNESAWSFTGVTVSTLINKFENIPNNYNITVTASDDWTSEYTKEQIDGTTDIYNETGNVTSTTGATMILAYKQDGEYIPIGENEAGPLRIAFVGDDVITSSNLWSKKVVSIEIVEV